MRARQPKTTHQGWVSSVRRIIPKSDSGRFAAPNLVRLQVAAHNLGSANFQPAAGSQLKEKGFRTGRIKPPLKPDLDIGSPLRFCRLGSLGSFIVGMLSGFLMRLVRGRMSLGGM